MKSGKIYALLVGINEYDSAPLNGCLKDVEQVEGYLRGQYPPEKLEIRVLRDQQATYEGITQGFREHLSLAGPSDAVWFHFSGHGTEAYASNEFLALEPNGKDQNLVCFDDGGHYLLADKEIAVLLEEIASRGEGQDESPHIVVSLDCCHSGSGTRDFGEPEGLKTRSLDLIKTRTRSEMGPDEIRPIDSYASGFYARQWKETHKLTVPAPRHVLLSACTSIEKAGDLYEGGVFTSSLIETLKAGQGKLNYADLFMRTRAVAHKVRKAQTPQFETINNFDPYVQFLEGVPLGTPDRYEVFSKNGKWMIKCGVIHGMPATPDLPIELEIQTAPPENKRVATAYLTSVGSQESKFEIPDGTTLNPDAFYMAAVRHLPVPPVRVWVEGDQKAIEGLVGIGDKAKNIHFETNTALRQDCQLEVEAIDGRFMIKDPKNKKSLEKYARDFADKKKVIEDLSKIVKWHRVLGLDNDSSKIRKWVEVELAYMDKQMNKHTLPSQEVTLYASEEHFFKEKGTGNMGVPFFPTLVVTHTKMDLYAYMFHMRTDYSIESYEGEVVFRTDEHPGKTQVEIPLWTGQWGWGLSVGEPEAVSYFKVMITPVPLDHHQLLQSGLKDLRSFKRQWRKLSVKNDWCVITYKVNMKRKNGL